VDLTVVRCLVEDLGADVGQANEDGSTALCIAARLGHLQVVQCLGKELGANVYQSLKVGSVPLYIAAKCGHLTVLRCLVKDLGAVVKFAGIHGDTALHEAARTGNLQVVQCLVKELGANVNCAGKDGVTPLWIASLKDHVAIVKWLTKENADPQAEPNYGTAEEIMKYQGATTEQTAYLEAKTYCSHTGCSGAALLKCTGCKQARYCGEVCQLAHWKAHKADCKANKKA
jgi:ankyrin repeat protein